MTTETSSSEFSQARLARMRGLLQRGFYPLLLREGDNGRVVAVDMREVLDWSASPESLRPGRLVGFPCLQPGDHGDFSPLEKERLTLMTARFLAVGYTVPALLTEHGGVAWYLDWPNAMGLQFSMGMTSGAGGRLRTSLRLVLPALRDYELHDGDGERRLRASRVRTGELPVHGLAGLTAAELTARYGVHVVGELSQLVSTARSAKVIQDVCAVFAAFARAVVAAPECAAAFAGGRGVAFSASAVPKLAAMLEKVVAVRLAPRIAPVARVQLARAGAPQWRRGTEEVPLLLCVRPGAGN